MLSQTIKDEFESIVEDTSSKYLWEFSEYNKDNYKPITDQALITYFEIEFRKRKHDYDSINIDIQEKR